VNLIEPKTGKMGLSDRSHNTSRQTDSLAYDY